MAATKFAKGSEEWQMFNDYWRLCQEIWIVEDSDEYWEDVVYKANQFYKKYNTEFSKELALALTEELERKQKQQKNGGKDVKTK